MWSCKIGDGWEFFHPEQVCAEYMAKGSCLTNWWRKRHHRHQVYFEWNVWLRQVKGIFNIFDHCAEIVCVNLDETVVLPDHHTGYISIWHLHE